MCVCVPVVYNRLLLLVCGTVAPYTFLDWVTLNESLSLAEHLIRYWLISDWLKLTSIRQILICDLAAELSITYWREVAPQRVCIFPWPQAETWINKIGK